MKTDVQQSTTNVCNSVSRPLSYRQLLFMVLIMVMTGIALFSIANIVNPLLPDPPDAAPAHNPAYLTQLIDASHANNGSTSLQYDVHLRPPDKRTFNDHMLAIAPSKGW